MATSKLSAFLHPAKAQEEKEIIISKRFQDENGNPVPFKIRSLTQAENDAIASKSRRTRKVSGQMQEYLDPVENSRRIVVAATLEPDFSDRELCEAYGTMDPLEVPGRMLKSGEYSKLLSAIMDLSGFDLNSVEDEAKN